MDGKNRITVTIQGQEYRLVSDDSKAFMHQVAAYVDDKMSEFSGVHQKIGMMRVAVLTALNIADEYHKLMAEVGAGNYELPSPGEFNSAKAQITHLSAELERKGMEHEAMTSQIEQFIDNSTAYETELENLREKLQVLSYELEHKEKALREKDDRVKTLEREVSDLKTQAVNEQ